METKTYQDCLTAANTILGLWESWEQEAGMAGTVAQDSDIELAVMREHLADAIHAVTNRRLNEFRNEVREAIRFLRLGCTNTAERRLEILLGES